MRSKSKPRAVVPTDTETLSETEGIRTVYREKTFRMGIPGANLDKALTLAAALEDEEILRKTPMRK